MKDLLDWLAQVTDTIPATRPFGWAGSSRYRRPAGTGGVRFGRDSGIRKLKRAMRRGMVPAERMQVIETAERSAARRAKVYANRRLDATRPEPPMAL